MSSTPVSYQPLNWLMGRNLAPSQQELRRSLIKKIALTMLVGVGLRANRWVTIPLAYLLPPTAVTLISLFASAVYRNKKIQPTPPVKPLTPINTPVSQLAVELSSQTTKAPSVEPIVSSLATPSPLPLRRKELYVKLETPEVQLSAETEEAMAACIELIKSGGEIFDAFALTWQRDYTKDEQFQGVGMVAVEFLRAFGADLGKVIQEDNRSIIDKINGILKALVEEYDPSHPRLLHPRFSIVGDHVLILVPTSGGTPYGLSAKWAAAIASEHVGVEVRHGIEGAVYKTYGPSFYKNEVDDCKKKIDLAKADQTLSIDVHLNFINIHGVIEHAKAKNVFLTFKESAFSPGVNLNTDIPPYEAQMIAEQFVLEALRSLNQDSPHYADEIDRLNKQLELCAPVYQGQQTAPLYRLTDSALEMQGINLNYLRHDQFLKLTALPIHFYQIFYTTPHSWTRTRGPDIRS